MLYQIAPHEVIWIPEYGIQENFCLWNVESWALEYGIQLKEFGILQRIGIQNPSSTEKVCNQVPGIWNLRRGIQNPGLSWIPLYGANQMSNLQKRGNEIVISEVIFQTE